MNVWKFIYRLGLIASILMVVAIVVFHFFLPKIREQRELRAREEELQQDIQRAAEQLRMLKLKQEKLQTDPRFIEKIAREDLGYAKPGETVFRFVDEEKP
jgi:cell division protein DivIC